VTTRNRRERSSLTGTGTTSRPWQSSSSTTSLAAFASAPTTRYRKTSSVRYRPGHVGRRGHDPGRPLRRSLYRAYRWDGPSCSNGSATRTLHLRVVGAQGGFPARFSLETPCSDSWNAVAPASGCLERSSAWPRPCDHPREAGGPWTNESRHSRDGTPTAPARDGALPRRRAGWAGTPLGQSLGQTRPYWAKRPGSTAWPDARVSPRLQAFLGPQREKRLASHARGRWFETSRAHL
jgi:hypothetical protein